MVCQSCQKSDDSLLKLSLSLFWRLLIREPRSRKKALAGADLGGSRKYSTDSWSGEGFHVNSNWTFSHVGPINHTLPVCFFLPETTGQFLPFLLLPPINGTSPCQPIDFLSKNLGWSVKGWAKKILLPLSLFLNSSVYEPVQLSQSFSALSLSYWSISTLSLHFPPTSPWRNTNEKSEYELLALHFPLTSEVNLATCTRKVNMNSFHSIFLSPLKSIWPHVVPLEFWESKKFQNPFQKNSWSFS